MSKVGDYVQLPYFVLDSEEYISLSASAKAILPELIKSMDGKNNGMLTFPVSEAKKRGFDSKTRAKALQELQEAGIILRTAGNRPPTKPEMFAVFWRDFTVKGCIFETQESRFTEWREKQKEHFRNYVRGKIPEALQ